MLSPSAEVCEVAALATVTSSRPLRRNTIATFAGALRQSGMRRGICVSRRRGGVIDEGFMEVVAGRVKLIGDLGRGLVPTLVSGTLKGS